MTPEVQITNDRLQIEFRAPFNLDGYDLFLKTKQLPEFNLQYRWQDDSYLLTAPARFAPMLGVQLKRRAVSGLDFYDGHFDYAAFFIDQALRAKRYALWWDTGFGKTLAALEWARQVAHITGGRVLLVVPLNIVEQWKDEATTFFGDELPLHQIESRAELRTWCAGPEDGAIGIVNPDKFIPRPGEDQKISEMNRLAGLVLDESSILASGGGVIKWALIHSCRGIEYKLSLTATPAPNDRMEYASQASFLEKIRNEGDVIWTYFVCDKKTGEWKIRENAADQFYRFMASWSCYLRNPARYGFADNVEAPPEPEILTHLIKPTDEQLRIASFIASATGQGCLFGADKVGVVGRIEAQEAAKGFQYLDKGKRYRTIDSFKPAFVADLIRQEIRDGRQTMIWTLYDAEAEILAQHLKDVKDIEWLTGKVKKADRVPMIERFRRGDTAALGSRASMLGFGLNFQFCTAMVYSGFDDSYTRLYQSMRRAYRRGQKRKMRIHFPYIRELEGIIWDNVQEKAGRWEEDTGKMEAAYIKAMEEILPKGVAA